jgi:HEAT repeat protein
MANESIRTALSGGDRRSIGNADGVAATIADDPRLFEACVRAISDDDPVVRMRAADAVEKASRSRPALLAAHKAALLGSVADIDQHEVRWHLLQLLPRLALTANEQRAWFQRALQWVRSDRRIVAAEALSALFGLARGDESLRGQAVTIAVQSLDAPSPALRARARKLLKNAGYQQSAHRRR